MPIYEYECESCKARTEVIQSFSDPPPTQCPRCGAALRKLFSAPSFQFKGSGWYATEYGGKSSGSTGEQSSEESGKSASGESSGAAKSDAPAEKSGAPADKSGAPAAKSDAPAAKSDAPAARPKSGGDKPT